MSLNASDFNKILRTYDYKQAKNRQIHVQRQQDIFTNFPRIKEIHESIGNIGVQSIRETMKYPHKKEEIKKRLQQDIDILNTEKGQLLEDYGYAKDYLELIYDCHDCKDTGYIGNQKCHCLQQALINYSYAQSNIATILEKENFSTFSFDYYSKNIIGNQPISPYDNMKLIYEDCHTFANSFSTDISSLETGNKNLILYGPSGLGKTFLCNCIAKKVLDSGHTVIYLSAYQLFRLFENFRFHTDEEIVSHDEIENVFSCDLLIIDDLGTEYINAVTSAELFNCLNTRILNDKATVISTNLLQKQWRDSYSERTVSRILGYYKPLRFFGNDIRLAKFS